MRPILIDSSAYIKFMRGDADAKLVLDAAASPAMNTIILGELLSGAAASARVQQNRNDLARFLASSAVNIYPIDPDTAEQYAKLFAQLRAAGTPLPTNDIWIAATALQHGLAVFTFDAHFSSIGGLVAGQTVAELSV